jgi:hypothetical protein
MAAIRHPEAALACDISSEQQLQLSVDWPLASYPFAGAQSQTAIRQFISA